MFSSCFYLVEPFLYLFLHVPEHDSYIPYGTRTVPYEQSDTCPRRLTYKNPLYLLYTTSYFARSSFTSEFLAQVRSRPRYRYRSRSRYRSPPSPTRAALDRLSVKVDKVRAHISFRSSITVSTVYRLLSFSPSPTTPTRADSDRSFY